jgi:hypothetical protein
MEPAVQIQTTVWTLESIGRYPRGFYISGGYDSQRREEYGHIAHVGMLLGLDVVENGLHHGYV